MADRVVRVVLRGEVAAFKAQMVSAAKTVRDTADNMTAAGKDAEKYRKHLSTIGTTAGGIGLIAAAGVGAIVAATANFDQAMSRVEAATHASASEMKGLRAAAIEAGKVTVFSASESADAITALSKAGVDAKDILGGGLKGALALASAGELDVAQAAEIAATAMNQFGLSGKDVPHIADVLAAAAGKAQGEVTDMAAALKYVGPVAHQMGVSLDETVGTIAELASQGILGEQAGTSLRGMLTALTSPSKQAKKEMDALGISLYDAQGNFTGLRGVAGQLGDTMGKLSNAERDQALGRIFGNEQITTARILYAGGAEAVDKWTKSVNDQGYAADTAAIKLDNLKGDLEQLRGSLETALIGAGEGSTNALRGMTQGATDAVNAFIALPPALQSTATNMLAITAITGGGLWFGTKVIRGVADTRAALEGLQVSGTRTRAVLSGIGTGLTFVAIIEGLNLVEKSMDSLFNQDLNATNLGRSLTALSRGEVAGEFLKKYGSDLKGFSEDISLATDKSMALNRTLGKTPFIGDFIAAPPWTKSVNDAADNLNTLDQALAGLVESGDGDKAAVIFDRLTQAAVDNGRSTADVKSQFSQYQLAVENAAASTSGAAHLMSDAMTGLIPATDGVTAATGPMGTAVRQSAADLEAQAKALEENRKRARETAAAFFGVGKSVNDSKVSLDGWIGDLEKQTAALNHFTQNVIKAGKRGVRDGLIAELEAAGPEGAMRLQQLADASDKEINRANRAWARGEKAVDRYVNVVGGVPPAVATDLNLTGDEAALAALARIDRQIHLIPKEWRTDYYVVQHNAITKRPQVADAQAHADGGTVAGPRYPYGDKVLVAAAPGEELITNRHGEADQFRADRAAGRIPAYAEGGTVSASAYVGRPSTGVAVSGGAGVDYDRLATAILGNRLSGFRDARDAHLAALRTALREVPVTRVTGDPSLLYGAA